MPMSSSAEQDWYRIRRMAEDNLVAVRMAKRRRVFSTNFSILDQQCTCGGEHNLVAVYDDNLQELDRICPCMYYVRWHLFSVLEDDIPEPPKDLIQRCSL